MTGKESQDTPSVELFQIKASADPIFVRLFQLSPGFEMT